MSAKLKAQIVRFCKERGADMTGFAPVERWDEYDEVPSDYRPQALWEPTRTVIVTGFSLPLPIVETTPSVPHMELYRTVNSALDRLAYDLTRYLNSLGHASFYFTHDGFSSLKALRRANLAAFSHVMAAKYAGLGTIGLSHCLLTPQFGPRVRFVSVFTKAFIPPDPVIDHDLCIHCELCARCCPKGALTAKGNSSLADYDKSACLDMAETLTRQRLYPCGVCIKVCPVGKDRDLYDQKGIGRKYLREREILEADPEATAYRSWTHIRKYGALDEAEAADKTGTIGIRIPEKDKDNHGPIQ
ncbi:MAG: epoxyqueuosine reductase [Deltaproteobacteria bacterium]|nr:epoxyqueuosine reductase [Deltaproteobacteria bacterium]